MNKIEYWLSKDSIGQDLFAQERTFLQDTVNRLQGHDSVLLSLGPVNIFNYVKPLSSNKGIYVSESMPGDIISSYAYLPFDKDSIDLLICYHALEFTQEKNLLIKEISRILKPEAYLVICSFNPHRLWFMNPKWQGDAILEKKNCMSVRQLSNEIKNSSMQVVEGQFMFYTPLLSSYINGRQIDFLEKAGNRWWPNFSAIYTLVAKKKILEILKDPVEDKLLEMRYVGFVPLTRKSDELY
ncbi:MAG: class I SAM-dependent methyltransferase [Neisseriaceae bacterium]|nr:class I SAM-dependent methyltransferase [Neisseriaceae bacterium]